MGDLRKELNVSDDEHTQLLAKVDTDSTVHQIRYSNYLNICNVVAKTKKHD